MKLWVERDLKKRFNGRIIPIDMRIAELAGKPMPSIDGLIAVSGIVYNCTVVTRNILDMEQSSAVLLNPWLDRV